MGENDLKKLILSGVFIGLSFIGSLIKLAGTVALDSLPAYLSAIVLGPFWGGLVGFIGHIFTSLTSGFPLTLPMHLFISIIMFIILYIFALVYKKSCYLAILIGILLNGPIAASLTTYIFVNLVESTLTMIQFFSVIIIPLTLASAVNIILANIIGRIITKKYNIIFW
ncbi:alpha-ribazole transporter [Anaerobranca californiensis DSM 14826]|uniref:Alpha-ribazole transporter n=1 Tax=Anaerobranca californiensis DSM 14826 TaxID=1120989 RepID=A0A1M6R8Y2_9FIRM|nr:ECF transporter S component [Anaerobranca californiensis]SHK28778.1 alpha-ribazole transporter [Anaerobranca californiensis DSM 14826]